MSAGRARVFFALWPPEPVRGALACLAQAARSECGGRAIAAANLHLTLFFVGSIDRARIPRLDSAERAVRAAPFDLAIDRLGYFRHARIVWAGAAHAPPQLVALADRLASALAGCGLEADARPYAPHVTLVRKATRRPAQQTMEACRWRVADYVLVESVPAAAGVRYQVLSQWRL